LVSHKEFEGRAKLGGTFCSGCKNTDDNGHGTHVAAIAGGKTFGVANKVRLISVRAFNATGFANNSDIMTGITFILNDHKKNSVVKYVTSFFIFILYVQICITKLFH
jgi:subtilisin family serine protease